MKTFVFVFVVLLVANCGAKSIFNLQPFDTLTQNLNDAIKNQDMLRSIYEKIAMFSAIQKKALLLPIVIMATDLTDPLNVGGLGDVGNVGGGGGSLPEPASPVNLLEEVGQNVEDLVGVGQ